MNRKFGLYDLAVNNSQNVLIADIRKLGVLIKKYYITRTFVLPGVGLVLRKINRLPMGNRPEIMLVLTDD